MLRKIRVKIATIRCITKVTEVTLCTHLHYMTSKQINPDFWLHLGHEPQCAGGTVQYIMHPKASKLLQQQL